MIPRPPAAPASPAVPATDASDDGWVVAVRTYAADGRVRADAALRDHDGVLLVAHGSARLGDDEVPSACRSAARVAAFRAVRRLADAGLRSAHEESGAVRSRVPVHGPRAAPHGD